MRLEFAAAADTVKAGKKEKTELVLLLTDHTGKISRR